MKSTHEVAKLTANYLLENALFCILLTLLGVLLFPITALVLLGLIAVGMLRDQ